MSKLSKRDRQVQREIERQQRQGQGPPGHTLIAHHQQLRIAPLPTSEELAQFDAVLPGLAERIVTMAEKNGDDRRRNNRAIRIVTVLGPVLAFVVAMTALLGGFYLVSQGMDAAGIAAIVTAIAAPLGVFIYRQARS